MGKKIFGLFSKNPAIYVKYIGMFLLLMLATFLLNNLPDFWSNRVGLFSYYLIAITLADSIMNKILGLN